jgi:MFS family permease
MSGLLTGSAFNKQFPEIDTQNGGSSSLQGTTVAIYEIGCFFGAILAFVFGERLGRRWMIMLGCAILTVGAAIQTAAYGVPQIISGRIVAGLGNGMNTATIRECSRTRERIKREDEY